MKMTTKLTRRKFLGGLGSAAAVAALSPIGEATRRSETVELPTIEGRKWRRTRIVASQFKIIGSGPLRSVPKLTWIR